MKKKFSGKAKAASVVAGILAAAGLGFLWGKKRNDKFEIDEFTIDPDEMTENDHQEDEFAENENTADDISDDNENNGSDENSDEEQTQDTEETDKQSTDRININTATADELSNISGIGKSKAINIIKYREENGRFDNIDDLLNVYGIARKKLDAISEYITV